MSLFKTCPRCQFQQCWIKAKICENCDYNFIKPPRNAWMEVKITPALIAKIRHFQKSMTFVEATQLVLHQVRQIQYWNMVIVPQREGAKVLDVA